MKRIAVTISDGCHTVMPKELDAMIPFVKDDEDTIVVDWFCVYGELDHDTMSIIWHHFDSCADGPVDDKACFIHPHVEHNSHSDGFDLKLCEVIYRDRGYSN